MATTDLSSLLPESVSQVLRQGAVIPAHPLALNAQRQLDPRRQRALSRYYIDAGAGGLAVGVHTTQFAIRENGMYAPVLEMAMQTAQDWTPLGGSRPLVMIAGVAGPTSQACAEAATAKAMGYHAGLLSLAALRGANEADILAHCRAVAQVIPLVGFYLQPAVGGVVLSAAFWEAFARIEQVVAIKMAPFNRYRTLDVIHGVVAAQAEERITLYTGNDDHIVLDLVTPFHVKRGAETVQVRIRGGLLGHWSVWTQKAVEQLKRCQEEAALGQISAELLALDSKVTDCNSALFDVAHEFAGCIAGCHEVLRRQGLLDGIWCLDPREALSAGQAEELTRVSQAYPDLIDDNFVKRHLARWLDG
jgi:dihydrodipicolinate synthase/N-acetylneuraminate lyase